MSVGALVEQVGEVLGRGHALFGEPPASGGTAARDSGSGLATAGDLVRTGTQRVSGLSGALPAGYTRFATDAGPALDAAADADSTLSSNLRESAEADRSGRQSSGSVVNGAASDTAALAPSTRTAAGQRALITALRGRLAQQQQVIAAHQAQDARLAAMVRSLAYSRRATGGGGMPMGGMPFGGGGGFGGGSGGGSPFSGLSGLSSLGGLGGGGSHNPRTTLASNVDWFNGNSVPGEPGQGAVKAALSKLGRPYVWGAKGPNVFDCSGLTQWAWGQAGVKLGNDTYAQIKEGIPVPPGQVRAGDLIFPLDSFGEGGKSGPGHVQMAISATQVVHAPQTGDVVRVVPMPGRYIARRPVRLAAA
ncbi:C40 family peptidase [Mycobacterium avium]|uniref:C40 family peptidase n=1 Tax=Mycobacterium avium TaxID=1764 RepID=UPI0020D2209E|nr:C40 family peptidase [Mycobacterium avium]